MSPEEIPSMVIMLENSLTALNNKCFDILLQTPITYDLPCLSSLPLLLEVLRIASFHSLSSSFTHGLLVQLLLLAWQVQNDSLLLTVLQAKQTCVNEHLSSLISLISQISLQHHQKHYQSFHYYQYFDTTSINQHILFLLRYSAYGSVMKRMGDDRIEVWLIAIEKEVKLFISKMETAKKEECLSILKNKKYVYGIVRHSITQQLIEVDGFGKVIDLLTQKEDSPITYQVQENRIAWIKKDKVIVEGVKRKDGLWIHGDSVEHVLKEGQVSCMNVGMKKALITSIYLHSTNTVYQITIHSGEPEIEVFL